MTKLKTIAVAAAAALLVSATAASAAITTFAQFTNASGGRNVRWVNSGNNGSNGTGGQLYTTATSGATSPGATKVRFMFEGALGILGDIEANFFMNITVANGNPATLSSGNLFQPIPIGSFSFTSTEDVVLGSRTFLAGTNLLTGEFTNAFISGSGSSGFYGDSITSTLTYTSAFLDFSNTTDRDFSMGLTSITPTLARSTSGGAKALRTFRSFANGSFSSDPAPLTVTIPEPEVWGMLVVGFGLVGLQVRRRKQTSSVVA